MPRMTSRNLVSPTTLVTRILPWQHGFYRRRFCIEPFATRQLLCNYMFMALFISFQSPKYFDSCNWALSTSISCILRSSVAIMASSLMVAASAILSFAAAAPFQNHPHSGLLEARQAPSCGIGTQVNSLAAYDSSCWDTLNIMPYLTNWKATTPTCTDAANSAGQTLSCCGASEPWSTCFLRLATKQLNVYDCTQVTSTECPLGADGGGLALDAGLDPTIASQVNYVVLNIIMINSFFTTYYSGQLLLRVCHKRQALIINLALLHVAPSEGQSLTSLLSNSSSTELNMMHVGVDVQNAMTALTLGLAFPKVRTCQL